MYFASFAAVPNRFFVHSSFPLSFYLVFLWLWFIATECVCVCLWVWVWSGIEYVDKFAWNGFCIVNILWRAKHVPLFWWSAKSKSHKTLNWNIYIFNQNGNNILPNNSCSVCMCTSRIVSLFDVGISKYQCIHLAMPYNETFSFQYSTGYENEASFDFLKICLCSSLCLCVCAGFFLSESSLIFFSFYFVQLCFLFSPANAKIGIQKTRN